jgi:tRNA-specific 2-thiouridylase
MHPRAGVDSSVAAALLAARDVDVIGLSMQLADQQGRPSPGRMLHPPGPERRTARGDEPGHAALDVLNLEERFADTVGATSSTQYASGRDAASRVRTAITDLKFSTLLERARALGASHVATGHYARVDRAPDGRWQLLRGVDATKDQFLFSCSQLTQEQLFGRGSFPVGALTKADVRRVRAASRIERTPRSRTGQEICCPSRAGHYASFLESSDARGGIAPAPSARSMAPFSAPMRAIHRFTVGQRKGLGVSARVPLYVVRIRRRAT